MATIPTYGAPKQDARPVGTPYVSTDRRGANGEAIVAGLDGVQDAVKVIDRQMKEEQAKADAATVADSEAKLTRKYTDLLHRPEPTKREGIEAAFNEEEQPEAGFLNQHGEAAMARRESTQAALDAAREEVAKELENDEQREMFMKRTGGMREDAYRQVETHTSRAVQEASVATQKARMEASMEAISASYDDPNIVARQIAAAEGPLRALALSPEDGENKVRNWRNAASERAVEAALAAGDVQRADGYVKGWKATGYLEAETAEKLQAHVDRAQTGENGIAAADQILAAAMPKEGSSAEWTYRMPDEAVMYQELQKLPPEVQKIALPVLNQRLALAKAGIKEKRDRFVDNAADLYNRKHGAFFGSDMANRLSKVDPALYRSMWTETQTLARRAGDDSAQTRREQKRDNELLMLAYKNAGDVDERLKVNVDTLSAGSGADKTGVEKVRAQQQRDKESSTSGLGTSEDSFKARARKDAMSRQPAMGTTPASRAAHKQWWAERDAAAIDAYQAWQTNHPGKKMTPSEQSAELAGVFAQIPVNPADPKSLKDNVDAVVERVAGKPVLLIGPKGERRTATANKELDQWLATHPAWKRQ